jgi:SAM-dependent methyltransferase
MPGLWPSVWRESADILSSRTDRGCVTDKLQQQTIDDFGEQWTKYTENSGYYASSGLLQDVFGPLVDIAALAGRRVAEIGAGTGRFVRLFVEAGASFVLAIEPSAAMDVMKRNTGDLPTVHYLQVPGDQLPASSDFDFVFSIGVLHHVPDPSAIVAAALRALRPGGTFAIWLYGKEGNGFYLFLLNGVLGVTRRLPHSLLASFVWLAYWPLAAYMHACRVLPLPLAGYMREVLLRFDRPTRRLVLYDQLNPAYAKYYTEAEAAGLLESAGFTGVQLYHRHGYSWAAVGRRPKEPSSGR